VLRDIRFHILSRIIEDSKKRQLSELRRAQRRAAWSEFCVAVALSGDEDDYRGETLFLPPAELERALSGVPIGNDRALIGGRCEEADTCVLNP